MKQPDISIEQPEGDLCIPLGHIPLPTQNKVFPSPVRAVCEILKEQFHFCLSCSLNKHFLRRPKYGLTVAHSKELFISSVDHHNSEPQGETMLSLTLDGPLPLVIATNEQSQGFNQHMLALQDSRHF